MNAFTTKRWLLLGIVLSVASASADVTINDARTFTTNGDTRYTLDGERISEAQLRTIGPGLVASVDVGGDVSEDFSSGTALAVDLDNLLKGPVTSTNPLAVLSQAVVITGDTVLADVPGNDVERLAVGDVVEVSGFADADNSVRATRIEHKPDGSPVWKLTGIASGVSTNRFNIGAQTVELNGVVVRDCDGGFAAGRLVEVKAAADSRFRPGDPLTTVTDVECQALGLNIVASQTVPAEVEGLVTAIIPPDAFVVNGQRVRTTAVTAYRGGSADDLVIGVKLEAQGRLDAATAVLTANQITFRETRVRIEAPASADDVVAGDSITLLGVTLRGTAQTRDEDGILSGGLAESRQLEVRGFLDRLGQVFATRVRERGDADEDDVRLRGPIGALNPPQFEVLGVTVDTSNSALPAQFFSRVSVGVSVQIEDARYDLASNTLSGGRIEIEQPSNSRRDALLSSPTGLRAGGAGAVAGTGIGTVTQISAGTGSDVLFSDGFEGGD